MSPAWAAKTYLRAASVANVYEIGLNDALAVIVMKEMGVAEIYSFDRGFDKVDSIRRITR